MHYFAGVHAQIGSLLPEPLVHLADWPPWHVILQSLPTSFLALHELLPLAAVPAFVSLDCGVLLGPHADRKTTSIATEYFIASTPSNTHFDRKKALSSCTTGKHTNSLTRDY
jgi:hypothetical protein